MEEKYFFTIPVYIYSPEEYKRKEERYFKKQSKRYKVDDSKESKKILMKLFIDIYGVLGNLIRLLVLLNYLFGVKISAESTILFLLNDFLFIKKIKNIIGMAKLLIWEFIMKNNLIQSMTLY